jgi:hypothetical protein
VKKAQRFLPVREQLKKELKKAPGKEQELKNPHQKKEHLQEDPHPKKGQELKNQPGKRLHEKGVDQQNKNAGGTFSENLPALLFPASA